MLKDRVTDHEVADAVKLAIVALVVLPLLPDRGVGPYRVLNPFRIWLPVHGGARYARVFALAMIPAAGAFAAVMVLAP